jgi:hypothetical protein
MKPAINHLDMFSALPDNVLLAILQLLDLRAAVRVGALGRRLRQGGDG